MPKKFVEHTRNTLGAPAVVRAPRLAMPHERDEAVELPSAPRRKMTQAAKDVATGLIDTDNYTRTLANFRRCAAGGASRGMRFLARGH